METTCPNCGSRYDPFRAASPAARQQASLRRADLSIPGGGQAALQAVQYLNHIRPVQMPNVGDVFVALAHAIPASGGVATILYSIFHPLAVAQARPDLVAPTIGVGIGIAFCGVLGFIYGEQTQTRIERRDVEFAAPEYEAAAPQPADTFVPAAAQPTPLYRYPADAGQLVAFAQGVLTGRKLTVREWTPRRSGKPFSRDEFDDLIDDLIGKGLLRPRPSDNEPSPGPTAAGQREFEKWVMDGARDFLETAARPTPPPQPRAAANGDTSLDHTVRTVHAHAPHSQMTPIKRPAAKPTPFIRPSLRKDN